MPFGPTLAGLCWAGAAGVALAFTDAAVHRLPNRLIATGTIGALVAFTAATATSGDWSRLGTACLSALGLSGIYLLVALVLPGFGLGDVKLALLVGLTAGWFGFATVAGAAVVAILINGAAAVAVAIRRGDLSGSIAHGPSMLVGTLVAILASGL
ncbi:prepilin peptidase [Micromonospora sp. DT4]|uniref:prepilin peptidase n=1 Tax=Micromonospora sp. DT4 TaxID=3393438 RepID=UPI003CE8F8CD